MLDLDLDLEADLGIDTVKQAEVFAADPRGATGSSATTALKLRDFPTLQPRRRLRRDERAPADDRAAPTAGARACRSPAAPRPPPASDEVAAASPGDRRRADRLPADMLDLDLDLEADLGIDTVKQAEVFAAVRERYGIARDDTLKLRDFPTLTTSSASSHDRTGSRAADPTPARRPPTPAAAAPAVAARGRPGAPATRRSRQRAGDRRRADRLPRPTCSTPTSTSRPTSASTPSSRPRCSPPSARRYGIERDDTLKLRDFPPCSHVVGFVARPHRRPRRPTATPGARPPAPRPCAAPRAAAPTPAEEIAAAILEIVAEKTGYPRRHARPRSRPRGRPRRRHRQAGRVFAAVRERYGIDRDDTLKLRDFPTLNHVVGFVDDRTARRAPARQHRAPPGRRGRPSRGPGRPSRPSSVPAPRARAGRSGRRWTRACPPA